MPAVSERTESQLEPSPTIIEQIEDLEALEALKMPISLASKLHDLSERCQLKVLSRGIGTTLAVGALTSAVAAVATFPQARKASPADFGPLPISIKVQSGHFTSKETGRSIVIGKNELILNRPKGIASQETAVTTNDIDFSKPFSLATDRYTVCRDEDNPVSRCIGFVSTLPAKALFLDTRAGSGLSEQECKSLITMLESNPRVSNLTVRINHNAVWTDTIRCFTDPELQKAEPAWYRWTLGAFSTLVSEFGSETMRGDYYNSITRTAVCYSGMPSVWAHEIGHHQDYQGHPSSIGYNVVGPWAPVILYKEARASLIAKNDLLPEKRNWEFWRFLLPAFMTYLTGIYAALRWKASLTTKDIDKDADKDLMIKPAQPLDIVRKYAEHGLSFAAAAGAFGFVNGSLHWGYLPAAIAFGAVGFGVYKLLNRVLEHVSPYPEEELSSGERSKLELLIELRKKEKK